MAKTKALISFAVTVKLICAFVFAYADSWFTHGAAQITWKNNHLHQPYLHNFFSARPGEFPAGMQVELANDKGGKCVVFFFFTLVPNSYSLLRISMQIYVQ